MSDVDELLADLASDSGLEDESPEQIEVDEEAVVNDNNGVDGVHDGTVENGHGKTDSDLDRLLHSQNMREVLTKIDEYAGQEQRRIMGIIEADPEYLIIAKANDIALEIDDETKRLHEIIKVRYAARFPELEKIVLHPLQYARAVRAIGNETDLSHLRLDDVISKSVQLSITLSVTTTEGRLLTLDELQAVLRACDIVIALDEAKTKIIRYLQSRIEIIAPNVTKIVGSMTAAKIIGQAGGINGLARCPSCNVPSYGKRQGIMNGFSRIGSQAQGFLYYCDLVQSVPEDVRKQALKQISGKLILAARIDAQHESPSGEYGLRFKDELMKKMEKLSEPPDLRDAKALPAPDDPKRSRRGGKKVRKAKEKFAITALQKQRNRMAFGKEEAEVSYGDDTEGMGMIGSSSSIRAPVIDKRTRAKLPKAKTKGGQPTGIAALFRDRLDAPARALYGQGNGIGSGSATSGMQSSLNFGSTQGIELPSLNVQALKKKGDDKWFEGGTYTQIKR